MPKNRQNIVDNNWLPMVFSTPDKCQRKEKFDLFGILDTNQSGNSCIL